MQVPGWEQHHGGRGAGEAGATPGAPPRAPGTAPWREAALRPQITETHFCKISPSYGSSIKPVLSSHPREAQKWPLKGGGCLMEVNIRTKLKFGNIVYGCLRQVGCLIEVTANTGLTYTRLVRKVCFFFELMVYSFF